MKLSDIVKIRTNNYDLVVLEVLPDHQFDLIDLGFDGNEKMFRLTKGGDHTCTIFSESGGELKSFSWHWGDGGHTLVSPLINEWGKMIQNCIVDDYGIYIDKSNDARCRADCAIMSIEDSCNIPRHVEAMVWRPTDDDVCVHIDGAFYKHLSGGINAIKPYFSDLGYKVTLKETTRSPNTNCYIYHYDIVR